jgi:predicted dehydrogenase
MRFGLVGTGHWAEVTHAPALTAGEGVELTAVWGRRPEAAQALAERVGARAYTDVDAMIADVDALAFAVPPQVQAPIAERAAAAGRHLLLEKPVALDPGAAAAVADAVASAGVASVVFFARRFQPAVRQWLDALDGQSWHGGHALLLGSAFAPGSPFDTPWRREHGGLWDVGPHALSLLMGALGPVTRVAATSGRGDLVHLVLQHDGGASSTATVSIGAPPPAACTQVSLWGEGGHTVMPTDQVDATQALGTAVAELVQAARTARPEHPCDVRLGRDVVDVLAQAQQNLRRG